MQANKTCKSEYSLWLDKVALRSHCLPNKYSCDRYETLPLSTIDKGGVSVNPNKRSS